MTSQVRSPRTVVVALVAVLAMAMALAAPAEATVDRGGSPSATETGRYLVVVHDGVEPGEVARDRGARPDHVYRHALRGFVAGMSPRDARRLESDARVRSVEGETIERIQSQTLPTGIDRIEADRNPTISTDGSASETVGLHIAVLDTGIAQHTDLNIAGGRNFANGSVNNWGDGNGHGTHVAGTIAAKDNGQGVVGVAPGANVWALRICGNSGFCMGGDIVAGIDWMTGQKAQGNIDFAAANFSISSADSDNNCASPANATHNAICGAVSAGIVFVMSAGNDGRLKVPYPVALSVSAIADFDGKPGGDGSPTCRNDQDDTLANFSNYGPKVRIAAPGVCILSTWRDGGYRSISGTSMSAPHVTGAVALYLHANEQAPATTAAGVRTIEDAITGSALPQGTSEQNPCSYDDSRLGGPLLFVNAPAFGGDGSCGDAEEPEPALSVTITDPADGAEGSGDEVTVTAETTGEVTSVELLLNGVRLGDATEVESGTWTYTWDSTQHDDDAYGLTAVASDGEDEESHAITVNVANDVSEPTDPEVTTVTVSGLDVHAHGRWHLRVTVQVTSVDGPVAGADVVLEVAPASGGDARSATVTTGSDGTATAQFGHALRDAGCWTATIHNVTRDGADWDGGYPTGASNC